MKLGALIFGGFFLMVGGVVAGMEIGWRQRDSAGDQIVTLTRTCPAPMVLPQPSRRECVEACIVRDRMGRVKGREG